MKFRKRILNKQLEKELKEKIMKFKRKKKKNERIVQRALVEIFEEQNEQEVEIIHD